MRRTLPPVKSENRILVICEGSEEYDYFDSLIKCRLWKHHIKLKNAESIDRIAPLYEYIYQNNNYKLVIIFCDTEKAPYTKFQAMKSKINAFHANHAADSIVFFANPCTMQIILSHFDKVSLKSNSKSDNANLIKKLAGIEEYKATEKQRKSLMNQIDRRNYLNMKENLKVLSTDYTVIPSTNVLILFSQLEKGDNKWLIDINKKIAK